MMENRNQAEQKEESVIMEEKKQKKQNEQIIRNTPVLPQDQRSEKYADGTAGFRAGRSEKDSAA